MNSLRSNNISLKYQRFTTLGFKDIGIINSEFVAKTQFLYVFCWDIHVFYTAKTDLESSNISTLLQVLDYDSYLCPDINIGLGLNTEV